MSVKEAAAVLDLAQQTLRVALQTEQLPYIGFAVKGAKQWTYTISREAVEKFLRGELCCKRIDELGKERMSA